MHNNIIPLWYRLLARLKGETSDPELFIPDTNPEKLIPQESLEKIIIAKIKEGITQSIIPIMMQCHYSFLADLFGPTLASLRFKHNYVFKTENYDIREIEEKEGTVAERQKIYETIIDSILADLPPEYKQAYKAIPAPPPTDDTEKEKKSMMLTVTGAAAMDLGLIEKLMSEEFKPHSIFVIHAGRAHVEFLTALLEANGWELIDRINSSKPSQWITSDPYLGEGLELFPFRAKPIDKATQEKIEKDIAQAIGIKIESERTQEGSK